MTNWEGADRRGMNQDQVERDRILTEVHSDVRHIVEWSKKHDELDNDRFEAVRKDIDWSKKILYGIIGVFFFVEFISKFIK